MASPVDICNFALAELPDKPISSLEENSLQARECNRVYLQALNELLERHPWRFATRRAVLAEIDNDRPSEWAFAYAMPDRVGMVRKIVWPQDPAPTEASYLTVGQRLAPSGANVWDRSPGQPYALAGSTIYTDVQGAVAEVVSTDETGFSALFVKALYFDIASRICTPLNRKADKKRELAGQAELWFSRAAAADLNQQQNGYDPMPEVFGGIG